MKYDARACKFNMDTGCVELLLRDGRKISIDCTGVEDAFRPALAAGGSLMAYKCLSLCGLFSFKGFCKSLFQIGFDFSQVVSRSLHCEAENLLLFRVSEIAGIVFERFLP